MKRFTLAEKRWRILTIVGVCLASLSLSGISASASCNPSTNDGARTSDYLHYYFDGWQYNGGSNTIGGVYSSIWNYSPFVDPAADWTYAWVMLTRDHQPGADAPLAQVGWMQWASGARHTMVMWHNPGGGYSYTYTDPPKAVNTYSSYEVLYNNTPGYLTFYVAGTNVYSVANFFVPSEAQVYGETHSFHSQMPGGHQSSLYYEDFLSSQYWLGSWKTFLPGAQIYDVDQNGYSESLYFGHTNPSSGGNLSIWDWDCAQ
jgi:hypothetical protein